MNCLHRTENKIKTCCKTGLSQCHIQTLHQDFRSRCIRTDINTDMAHDPNERQENKRFSQQGKARFEAGRFIGFLLIVAPFPIFLRI